MRQLLIALILGLLLSSCASFQRLGIGTASDLFYQASEEMETEGNWSFFKKSVPPNLKLLESLLYLKPGDDELLVSLIKGHTGYGYAVEETLWLRDDIRELEKSPHKEQALYHYSKAFEYALRYFKERDLNYKELKSSISDKKGVPGLLSEYLDGDEKQDLEAVLFGGQALGAMVNLQRDNMLMVGELPLAKGLFDWVCEEKPQINFGACKIFYGAYYAGRPAMLGGNPQKGKEIFQKLMKSSPHNWLAKVSYMQYYLIPQEKEEEYEVLAKQMRKYLDKHQKELKWSPQSATNNKKDEAFAEPRLRVYQAMAMKRFEILEKYRDRLFE